MPLTISLSIALSLAVGIIAFGDTFSYLQIIGVILVVLNIFIWKQGLDFIKVKKAFALVSLATILPVINQFVRKVGVSSFEIESLQFFQYLFVFIFVSFIIWKNKQKTETGKTKYIYIYGTIMGFASFFGSWFLFMALKEGPYGFVTLVSFLSFIFTSLIGVFLFKEKFTLKNFISLIIVILGIVLIRVGF